MFRVSGFGCFVIHIGEDFAHGLPPEFEAKRILDDAIEDSVCEVGSPMTSCHTLIGNRLVIMFASRSYLFRQFPSGRGLRRRQPVWPLIVEDQKMGFCDAAEQAGKTPVNIS